MANHESMQRVLKEYEGETSAPQVGSGAQAPGLSMGEAQMLGGRDISRTQGVERLMMNTADLSAPQSETGMLGQRDAARAQGVEGMLGASVSPDAGPVGPQSGDVATPEGIPEQGVGAPSQNGRVYSPDEQKRIDYLIEEIRMAKDRVQRNPDKSNASNHKWYQQSNNARRELDKLGYELPPWMASGTTGSEAAYGYGREEWLEGAAEQEGFLKDQASAQKAAEAARINEAAQKEVLRIQQAYNDAVMNGQLSQRQAEEQFAKNQEQIMNQAYLDTQRTNLASSSRGISNSQQSIALQQGDDARKNTVLQTNRSERDTRLADIRDRLNKITLDKDLEVSSVETSRENALIGSESEIDAQLSGQLASNRAQERAQDWESQQDHFNRHQDNAWQKEHDDVAHGLLLEQMAKAHELDLDKMSQSQKDVLEQLSKKHGYDLEKIEKDQEFQTEIIGKQHEQRLAEMAKAHGYDLAKMSQSQKDLLARLAREHSYDMAKVRSDQEFRTAFQAADFTHDKQMLEAQLQSGIDLENLKHENQSSMNTTEFRRAKALATHNYEIAKQREEYEYTLARNRELRKFTPGSAEYRLREAQLDEQWEIMKKEMEIAAMADAIATVEGERTQANQTDGSRRPASGHSGMRPGPEQKSF